jgi:hypothetical protein
MDKLIQLLVASGENVFLIILVMSLLLAVVMLWRELLKGYERTRADGLMMTNAMQGSSEKLDRLTDAIEETNRTRQALVSEMVRLNDRMEAEGKFNRLSIDHLSSRIRGNP